MDSGLPKEWVEDCLYWHGRILQGGYGHWCPEWDGLPIDDTCEEFKACNCYGESEYNRRYRETRSSQLR